MIYPIVKDPAPILRGPVLPYTDEELNTPKLHTLVKDMIESMYAAKGVGLASTQIGLNKQIVIIGPPEKEPYAAINPQILSRSLRKTDSEEGCLSVPGTFGFVRRNLSIKATWLTPEGKRMKKDFKDFEAIIWQHEVDHINGILFIDKATDIQKLGVKK